MAHFNTKPPKTLCSSLHFTMLSRFIPKCAQFHRLLTLTRSPTHLLNSRPISPNPIFANRNHYFSPRIPHCSFFSSKGENGGDDSASSTTDLWKLSSEADDDIDSVFSAGPREIDDRNGDLVRNGDGNMGGVFGASEWKDSGGDIFGGGGGVEEEVEGQDIEPWKFGDEGKEGSEEDVFGVEADGHVMGLSDLEDGLGERIGKSEQELQLESEEKELTAVLKGQDRVFGDLIASSGITDEMLDSLIALKDFEGIQGLPPLSEIEDKRYEKNAKKSGRAEMERLKQEEAAKARVRKVDEKGRSYGTGKRKCSIARVWLQPGDGRFIVNDKEFDVYFPMLDHRAALLRPFSETKTLGMWNVSCTVKGGGTSGQVGAIRLGISRALQNWEPGLRPPLKQAGFLTRDSRIVERKKPGKAKARKSFQWVKR